MAHFPTWSHGIFMWLRWHLDCIYCLAMGHLYSPEYDNHCFDKVPIFLALARAMFCISNLSPSVFLLVFVFQFPLFLPEESIHKAACCMVTGGDALIHVHHPYIYDSFQNIHVMVTADLDSDNSASSRYCWRHWIPLHCVKEDFKYTTCCDVC